MAVDKLNLQSLATILSQYQRHINLLIVALLVMYLLALIADLAWRIIPEPDAPSQNFSSVTASSTGSQSAQRSDLGSVSALQRLNLFGKLTQEAPKPVEDAVKDAPETRLNLVLSGVVASSSPEFGAAIIEHKGLQNTYGLGDKIDGTNATLRQVQPDRVIIQNNRRDETLMLEGVDFEEARRNQEVVRTSEAQTEKQARTPPRPDVRHAEQPIRRPAVTQTERPRLSEEAVAATQKLRGTPDSFIDFIKIAPQRKDGKTIGYRVSPGKDPALFSAVGLETGDVITFINGLDVTDTSQTIEALGILRSAESIELTINRKEEVLTLFLEIPEATDN